jgi:hypothetical protein
MGKLKSAGGSLICNKLQGRKSGSDNKSTLTKLLLNTRCYFNYRNSNNQRAIKITLANL